MSSLDDRRGRLEHLTCRHERTNHENKAASGATRSDRLFLLELRGDIDVLFDRLLEQIDLEL